MGALATAYKEIGFVYRENNNIEMGLSSYKKTYKLSTEMGNESDRSFYAANTGSVLLELKKVDEAFSYFKQPIKKAVPENNLSIFKIAYRGIANYYFIKNKLDSAIHHELLYQNVVDTIFSTTTSKQINELQTQYETEKKNNK